METLKKGTLAYYESLGGLVPVKVTKIEPYVSMGPGLAPRDGEHLVFFIFTTDNHMGKKGDTFDSHHNHVFPRKCVHAKRGTYGMQHYVDRYNVEEG